MKEYSGDISRSRKLEAFTALQTLPYFSICQEGLKKICAKPGRNLNQAPLEYKFRALLLDQTISTSFSSYA
jgi:hypothetical protein